MFQVSSKIKETVTFASSVLALAVLSFACKPIDRNNSNTKDLDSATEFTTTSIFSRDKIILEILSQHGENGSYSFEDYMDRYVELFVEKDSSGYVINVKASLWDRESVDQEGHKYIAYELAKIEFNSNGQCSQLITWLSHEYIEGENEDLIIFPYEPIRKEPSMESFSFPDYTLELLRKHGYRIGERG